MVTSLPIATCRDFARMPTLAWLALALLIPISASSLAFDMTPDADARQIAILDDPQVSRAHALPDYSYAGYANGLRKPPVASGTLVDARTYGAIADDALDDTRAITKALAAANAIEGPVIVELPPGRLIVNEALRIERGHLVLRGAGKGPGGTELYFPMPLKMVDRSNALDELRTYLLRYDKRQIEPENNIDAPFSEYSWSGGFLWVQPPGTRPAPYLEERDEAPGIRRLAKAIQGNRGEQQLRVSSTAKLKAGDVVQIRWFNPKGQKGPLLREIYGDTDLAIGAHHWSFPNRAIVVQSTRILDIEGDKITLSDTLLHNIAEGLDADVASWKRLDEVGIEDLALVFPAAATFAHHLEQGYNGIYMTGVFDGWIRDVRIENADSGVLTYDSANLTLSGISTEGERTAHYSVHAGNVHNVLVSDLLVFNPVIHPLSVNTQATRSVFLRAHVFQRPTLDQHAGANHQNLFDNVTFYVKARRDARGPWYPVWDGSGAPYWQPGHGRYNTTWNLQVIVTSGAAPGETVRLVGAAEGPDARVVGIFGNRTFEVDYKPSPYLEQVNQRLINTPSLYEYQLARRQSAKAPASR